MKFLVTAALLGSAAAFAPSALPRARARASVFAESESASTPEATTDAVEPAPTKTEFINTPQEDIEGSRRAAQNSFSEVNTAVFKRPALFDEVKIAGDAGFDPFSLASDKATLLSYRGAELRHSRLAMLAVIGWPMSELIQPNLATDLKLPILTANGGLAPSVLNGGLGQVTPTFWLFAMALGAAIEFESLDREKEGKMPGDIGFDPFNMKSSHMEEAELANGRLAMFAITGFAFQEAATKLFGSGKPVIDETPFFFHPLF